MSSKTKSKQFLCDLEPVRRQLEEWRRSRKNQRALTPPHVWEAMALLARTHGINRVCRALRVDYYALKRRVQGPQAALPTFVEVFPPIAPQAAGDIVEVEDRRGRKMTLRLSPNNRADTLALIQSFWRRT